MLKHQHQIYVQQPGGGKFRRKVPPSCGFAYMDEIQRDNNGNHEIIMSGQLFLMEEKTDSKYNTCIREVPASNLGSDADHPELFNVFPQFR
jgi:hypothetical protein